LRARIIAEGEWDGDNPEAFASACQRVAERGRSLMVLSKYEAPPGIHWDDQAYRGDAYATYAWAAYIAEVSVDPATYTVKVEDFVAIQDIGRVIHPTLAAGQVEGGVAQAIGFALYEHVVWREGRMANHSMTNYIMPGAVDLPAIRTGFMDWPTQHGPGGGAKGLGELPMDGAAPAILNAIAHATGVEAAVVPYLPEELFKEWSRREPVRPLAPACIDPRRRP